jgi:putative transposase
MTHHPRLAKSIHDAGWAAFLDTLQSKAESAGPEVVRVPAHHPSQRCSTCWETTPKGLSVGVHICRSCGYSADRDHNSARNILELGLARSRERAGAPPSGPPSHT